MLQHAFPVPFKSALHKRQEQIRDERYPDLDLDRVLAYAMEVAQRKVLFKLFEERLDFPFSAFAGFSMKLSWVAAEVNLMSLGFTAS